MPRSRTRSRSRGRRGDEKKDDRDRNERNDRNDRDRNDRDRNDRDRNDHKEQRKEERKEDRKEGVAEAAKSGSSEQEIVSVAIRQLPGDIRERLEKLFEEGLLKEGDLDLRSITVFASLNEGLQARVMNHMENERIYVANARSKSGFLIATCDKAKTGCLDARGLGAIDPWRTALVAMATPKQKMIDLKPERDWLEKHDEGAIIKIHVNVQIVESELGVPSVTVELPLSETSAAVKAKLVAMGVKKIPANRMKLHTDPVGFLKEGHTFAFYNLSDGVTLALSERKRAGVRFRADHTAMPKRPRTQPQPGEPASAVDALQKLVNSAPKLPALPALPKLPGLPAPGTLPGPGLPLTLPGASPPPGLGGSGPGGMASLFQGTGPGGMAALLAGSGPGAMTALLQGMRPPTPGGMTLPGGMQLPGGGVPNLGALGGLTLPKLLDSKAAMPMPGLLSLTGPGTDGPKAAPLLMPSADPKAGALGLVMNDMAKAKAPLLNPDSKAPGLAMPLAMDPKSFPPMPLLADPKAAAMAMMAKMGGMALSMPAAMGNMSKAPGGFLGGLPLGPGGPVGLPPGIPAGLPLGPPGGVPGMTMPMMDGAAPKMQSKSQMPSVFSGTIPKMQGGIGLGGGPPPLAEAVAAATPKAAPP